MKDEILINLLLYLNCTAVISWAVWYLEQITYVDIVFSCLTHQTIPWRASWHFGELPADKTLWFGDIEFSLLLQDSSHRSGHSVDFKWIENIFINIHKRWIAWISLTRSLKNHNLWSRKTTRAHMNNIHPTWSLSHLQTEIQEHGEDSDKPVEKKRKERQEARN